MTEQNITVNGKPVEFTYTNEVTVIEHTFLRNFLKRRL